MPLDPQKIAAHEFPIVRRGYDQERVDAFLKQVAKEYRALLENRRAPTAPGAADPFGDLGEEVGRVLKAAKEASDVVKQKLDQEVEDVRRRAKEEALEIRREAQSTAGSAMAAAEEAAAGARRDADEYARGISEAAERQAREVREQSEAQSRELLDDAVRRHERLQEHERELRARIEAVESALSLLRAEMDATPPEAAQGAAGEGGGPGIDIESVQPVPTPAEDVGENIPR